MNDDCMMMIIRATYALMAWAYMDLVSPYIEGCNAMARLNARRRREAKLVVALNLLANSRNPTTQAASGIVRSSHKPELLATQSFHAPRPLNFDGQGKRGRIVDGKVKSPRPKRFH